MVSDACAVVLDKQTHDLNVVNSWKRRVNNTKSHGAMRIAGPKLFSCPQSFIGVTDGPTSKKYYTNHEFLP